MYLKEFPKLIYHAKDTKNKWQSQIQEFQNQGQCPDEAEFLGAQIVLMHIHIYPMLL